MDTFNVYCAFVRFEINIFLLSFKVKKNMSCSFQTLVLRPDQIDAFGAAYTTLFNKSFDLFRCTGEIENIVSVDPGSMAQGNVRVVRCVLFFYKNTLYSYFIRIFYILYFIRILF